MEKSNSSFKRFISMLLAVVMVFSMFPAGVFAAGEEEPEQPLPAEPAVEEELPPAGEEKLPPSGTEETPSPEAGPSPDRYTVSFDALGGSPAEAITVTFGQPYGKLPVSEKEGFTFLGWALENGDPVTSDTLVATVGSHTLFARWEEAAPAETASPMEIESPVETPAPAKTARPPLKTAAAPGKPAGLYILRNGVSYCLDTGAGTPVSILYGDTVTVEIVWPTNLENVDRFKLRLKDGDAYGEICTLNSDGTAVYTFLRDAREQPYELMTEYYADEISPQGDRTNKRFLSDAGLSFLKINPVAISAPAVSWNGTEASWNASTTVNGLSVTPVSYSYTVYRNGAAVSSGSGASVDLAGVIALNGSGKYGVKVKAIAAENSNYLDSAESAESFCADSAAPAVSGFFASTVPGRMTATVADSQSGVQYYAFSKATEPTAVSDGEKKAADASVAPGTSLTCSFDADSAGTWYFYAWDFFGNAVRSSSGIVSGELQYKKYYVQNVLTPQSDFLLDGQSKQISLPDPERTGYVFTGWYTDDACTAPVENNTVSAALGSVTAGWEPISLAITVNPAAAGNSWSKIYDGTPLILEASADTRGAAVAWSWQNKATGETVSSASQCSFTGVKESGTYVVTASTTILNALGETVPVTNSAELTVTVRPATLVLIVESPEIFFGDEARAYTARVTGFVNGETASTAAGYRVSLECVYRKNGNGGAGVYPVTASATAYNYAFSITNGTLTVKPLPVIAEEVAVSLSETEFTYDGTDRYPEVTVRYAGKTLVSGTDYTVAWPEDARHAGDKTLTITFIGNYAGSASASYTIRKATLSEAAVVLGSKTYDGTADVPRLTGTGTNPESPEAEFPSASNVTYLYATAVIDPANPANNVVGEALAAAPVNAGSYCVRAVIAPENDNYAETVTAPVFYEISPRDIRIHAGSKSFRYDATAHSYDYWYVDEGTPLVGTDKIISVTVTGSVTNVTWNSATGQDEPAANVPSNAVLSRSALPSNYRILYENGALSVGDGTLSAPTGLRWDSSIPGMARWSEVSADGNVLVKYYVYLFRVDGDGVTQLNDDMNPYQTESGAFINLESQIRADYKTYGTPAAYAFKVVSAVNGGADAANYKDSEKSALSGNLNTLLLIVDPSDEGVASAVITGGTETSAFLISGDTVNLTAVPATGYNLMPTVWTANPADRVTILNPELASTDVKAIPDIPGTCTLKPHTADEGPRIAEGSYAAENITSGTDAGKVRLSFTATDAIGIVKWAITRSATAPAADAEDWNVLSAPAASLSESLAVNEAGGYYIHVSDGTTVTTSREPLQVYVMTFLPGDPAVTGSVPPVAKAGGKGISLPAADGFDYPEHGFKGWLCNGSIFAAGESFNEDASSMFTARWGTADVTCTVDYYYQSIDTDHGNAVSYPAGPSSSVSRAKKSGETVNFFSDTLDVPRTGFELDCIVLNGVTVSAADLTADNAGILLSTESDNSILVYYKRCEYALSFSCPGAENLPAPVAYKFGARLHDEECETVKPQREGYDFYGWYYNNSPSKPEFMPASNIEATGSFSTKSIGYKVVYYLERLDGTYELSSELTESKSGYFNSGYSFSTASTDLKSVTGFSPKSVDRQYYADLSSLPATEAANAGAASVSGKMTMQQTMVIRVFLARNLYDLTINVLKAPRENNEMVFTHTEKVRYGAVPSLTPAVPGYGTMPVSSFGDYESFGRLPQGGDADLWRSGYCQTAGSEALDGYVLANFADWSTGSAPTAMPAANVTVVREYVLDDETPFTVIFKFADARNGSAEQTYTTVGTFTFSATANTNVTIGQDANGVKHDVNINNVVKELTDYKYYDIDHCTYKTNQVSIDPATGETVYGYRAVRESADTEQLVIVVYAERKAYTTTVTYYAVDDQGQNRIATMTVTGKWGERFATEPLRYFDAAVAPHKTALTVGGVTVTDNLTDEFAACHAQSAATFDFRNAGYSVAVNFGGYVDINTIKDLNTYDVHTAAIAKGNSTYSVYYKLRNETYVINLNYESSLKYYPDSDNEPASRPLTKPLTVTIGGTEYKLRAANLSDIFNGSLVPVSEGYESAYPAATGNFTFVSAGTLKNGFTAVTADDGTVYYVTDLDNGDYAYLAAESNPFFYRYRAYYSYSAVPAGPKAVIGSFRNTYLANHGETPALTQDEDYERITRTDYNYDSVRNLPTNWTGPFSDPGALSVSKLYYTNLLTYDLSFKIISLAYECSGHTHSYAAGKMVQPFACSTAANYQPRAGYRLAWYTDPQYKNPWTAALKMDADKSVYGRYEKEEISNKGYVFYQLEDGTYLSVDDIKNGLTGLTGELTSTGTVTLTDTSILLSNGQPRTITATAETYTYQLNGQLAAVVTDLPAVAFNDIELDYVNYAEPHYHLKHEDPKEGSDGETTPSAESNWLKDYCQYVPIELKAYYERDTVSLVTDPNTRRYYRDKTVSTGIWGRTELLPVLEDASNGYDFLGWEFYTCSYDSASDVWTKSADKVTSSVSCTEQKDAAGNVTGYIVSMPEYDLWAEGQWGNAAFAQSVIHYFPNASKNYEPDKVAALRSAFCGSREDALTDTGTFLISGGGVAEVLQTGENALVRYYDCGSAEEAGELTLIGIIQWTKMTNNASVPVSTLIQSTEHFDFSYALRRISNSNTTLSSGENISVYYPMELDCYYTAKTYAVDEEQEDVTAYVLATDNGSVGGSTIAGTGSYAFKELCVLNVTMDLGYSFAGWYPASGVLTAEGKFNEGLTEAQLAALRFSPDLTCSFVTSGPIEMVALLRPNKVDVPTVAIDSKNAYEYGYSSSIDLRAVISLPSDAAGETVVDPDAYLWQEQVPVTDPATGETQWIWKDIPGATSETCPFPTGKDAGVYAYRCVVTARNKNNGRTLTAESDVYNITVKPTDADVYILGTVDVYDATYNHAFTFANAGSRIWNTDFELYVSDTELTELSGGTKLNDASGLEQFRYRDAGEYTLWYYLVSKNPNLSAPDTVQMASVRILPKAVTASAAGSLVKTYDGTTDLTSLNRRQLLQSVTDGTLFTIAGLCPGDDTAYFLDYTTALYDHPHSAEASTVVLTNIRLLGTENAVENYTFGDGASLTVYGRIDPLELPTVWGPGAAGTQDDTGISYAFDNAPHTPVASYAANGPVAGEFPALRVSVNGENCTDAGSYVAAAELLADEASETDGNYKASDYKLTNNTSPFRIVPRPVTISPCPDSSHPAALTYDGGQHTYTSFVSDPALPENFRIIASPVGSYVHAGTHTVTTAKEGLMILDAAGQEATDNFTITLGSAQLVIDKRPVTVTGIDYADRVYDGSAAAETLTEEVTLRSGGKLLCDSAVLGSVVSGDELFVTGITGTFDTPHVGADKTVTLNCSGAALAGASSEDYRIATPEEGSQTTALADITPATVYVQFTAADVTYGQDITVVPAYTDASGTKVPASGITGSLTFTLNGTDVAHLISSGTDGSEESYTFSFETAGIPSASAAAYSVTADVTGLHRPVDGVDGDYVFTADSFSLKVNRRPVSVSAIDATFGVTKVYDETTAATADNLASILAGSYRIGAVSGVPESGIYRTDSVTLKSAAAAYNDPDVPDADTVTVSSCLLSDAAAVNYVLSNDSYEILGSITKKPVTVTPDANQNKIYGNADPVLTFTAKSGSATVANGKLAVLIWRDNGEDVFDGYVIHTSSDTDNDPTTDNNPNYEITCNTGVFVIKDRPLYVSPDAARSFTYGDGYASAGFAAYTPVVTGWAAGDETVFGPDLLAAVTGYRWSASAPKNAFNEPEVSSGTLLSSGTILDAGSYYAGVVLDESSLGTLKEKYRIVLSPQPVTVAKKTVTVTSGITAADKTYDGGKTAALDLTGAVFEGLIAQDEGTVTLSLAPAQVSGTFSDKKAAAGKTVTIAYGSSALQISGTNLTNYQLAASGNQGTAQASITPKDLHVKADDKTVVYGTPVSGLPAFTLTYTASDFVTGDTAANSVSGTAAFAEPGYAPTSPVDATDGVFPISLVEGSITSGNYRLLPAAGTLTVVPARFVAPVPAWDSSVPGKVTWSAVAPISEAVPQSYVLTLYKNGSAVQTVTVDATGAQSYEYSFADYIHGTGGPGAYKVTAKTVSSNPANAKDSLPGTETSALYAAEVTVCYKNDAATAAGKGAGSISLERSSDKAASSTGTLLLIAGESMGVTADIANDTGYLADNAETGSSKLSLTKPVVADAAFNEATTLGFTLELKAGLQSADPVTAEISLAKKPATLDLSMQAYYQGSEVNALIYNYVNTDVKIVTTPSTVNDNVGTDAYRYTCSWVVWDNYPDAKTPVTGVTGLVWESSSGFAFPGGLAVPGGSYPLYPVFCTVTAERLDNGETVTIKDKTLVLPVEPAYVYPTVQSSSWTYGESRDYKDVSSNPGSATVDWFYSASRYTGDLPASYTAAWLNERKTADGWIEGRPTDAGTWYIYAYVRSSANFKAGWSSSEDAAGTVPTVITIRPAKLSAPQNLKLVHEEDGNVYYGNASWDGVTTFAPSYVPAGGTEPVTNANNVNLQENLGTQGASASQIKVTYDIVLKKDGTELKTWGNVSATDYILNITPFLTDQGRYTFEITAKSGNTDNCLHSDAVSGEIEISKTLQASVDGGTPATDAVSKVYNGKPVVLSIKEEGNYTYAWYKDSGSAPISTASTLTLYDVADSGEYTCVLRDEVIEFSTSMQVSITKRPITLTPDSAEKIFDGTALTCPGFTVTGGSGVGLDDETLTYGLQEGSSTAKNGSAASSLHTLTLSMTADSAQTDATMDYRSAAEGKNLQTGVSVAGQEYGIRYNIIDEDSVTITRTVGNTATDVTENYDISTVVSDAGVLKVSPKDVGELSIETPADSLYTGLPQQPKPTVTYAVSQTKSIILTENTDFTYSYSDDCTNVGTVTVTATGKGNYAGSVSTAFAITRAPLLISANDSTVTYGDAAANKGVSYTGLVNSENPEKVLGSPSGWSYAYTSEGTGWTQNVRYQGAAPVPADASAYDASSSPVGNYVISLSGWTSGNYDITFETGRMTVGPADIVIDSCGQKSGNEGSVIYNGDAQDLLALGKLTDAATTVNAQAAHWFYSTDNSSWSADFPLFTEAGAYTVYYKVTADNHNDATGSYTVTVSKAALALASLSKDWTYDGARHVNNVYTVTLNGSEITTTAGGAGTLTYTISNGDVLTITPAPVDGGVQDYSADYLNNNVFTLALLRGTADRSGNYTVTTSFGTLSISKADITGITAAQSGTLTYDGTAQTATLTTAATTVNSQPATFLYSTSETGPFTATVPAFTTAGEHTVYYKVTAPNHNDSAVGSFPITIARRAVTITAAAAEKKYGEADPSFDDAVMTNNVSGELGGISLAVVRSDKAAAVGESVKVHSGVLSISATKSELETAYPNYTFTITPADFEIKITDAPLTVTSATRSWTYDGTVHTEEVYTVTLDGKKIDADEGTNGKVFTLYNGDKLTVTAAAAGVKDYDAGYSENNTFTYTLANPGWYTSQTAVTGTLSIGKRAVTIAAAADDKKYGEADPAFDDAVMTNNVSGELGGISLAVVRSDKSNADGESVKVHSGVLSISATKLELETAYPNYTFTITPADFEIKITDASLTVTSATKSWTYDGLVHTEEVYTVTLDGSTIAADEGTGGKVFTLYNGDKLTVTATAAGVKDYDATYSRNNTFTYKLTNDANYASQTVVFGTLSIDKAEITGITASQSGTLTYDGTAQTATLSTAATTVNSQPATFLYSISETGPFTATVPAFTTAGEHTVYYKVTAPNHNDSAVGSFPVTIARRAATIKAAAAMKIYGTDDPAFAAATLSGAVAEELDAIDLTVFRTDKGGKNGEVAGTHTGVLTIQSTKAELDAAYPDYVFTVIPADFIISATPAEIRIESSTGNFDYDGKNHTLETYTVTLGKTVLEPDAGSGGKVFTLYNGDKLTIASTASGVRDYSADYSENNTFSYTLDHSDGYPEPASKFGTLSINKAAITGLNVSQNAPLTYSGTAQAPSLTETAVTVNDQPVTYLYSTDPAGPFTGTVPTFEQAGEYTVYCKATAPNHEDSGTVSFPIRVDRKPVTLTGNDGKTFYSGKEQSVAEITAAGLVSGHSHTAVYTAKGTDAGTYPGTITPAAEIRILSGEKDVTANYEITAKAGSFTIEPVTVTIVWSGERTYRFDGKLHGVTATITTDTGSGVIKGLLPESGAKFTVMNNSQKDVGDYTATVAFSGTGANYVLPNNRTLTWKIQKNPAILVEENPEGDINRCKVIEKDTDTLTAELSEETNIEDPVYKWYRKYADGDWEYIPGSETNGGYTSSYKLTEDDVSAYIKCEMTDALVEGTVVADKIAYVPLYFTKGMGQTYNSALAAAADRPAADTAITTTTVPGGAATATATAVAASASAGAAETVLTGTGEDAPFETNGKYSRFLYPMVDGVRLDESSYTTAEGCTEIILRSWYLDTLSEEKHILTAVYEGGASCDTDFYVQFIQRDPPTDSAPDGTNGANGGTSGEHKDVALPFLAMVAAAVTQARYHRKRKETLEEIEALKAELEKQ